MATPGTRDVAAERAAIERAIDGMTVCHVLARNAEQMGDRPALFWKQGSSWRRLTWGEYRDQVKRVALGLTSLGVGPGDFVTIMCRNRPEHLIADLGVLHAGAVPVSVYNTLAPEQIAYIAAHCQAKVAVVEDRGFLERWEKVRADLPALERVVLIEDSDEPAGGEWLVGWGELQRSGLALLGADPDAFDRSWRQVRPEDPATLIYTSGTTGPPKGVVLTHRNALWTCASLDATGAYPSGIRAVSYLPLAHSLERFGTHYLSMYRAAQVYFCPDPLKVFEVVPEVHPQGFAGVPRVWEKLQAGIIAALAAEPDGRKRRIGQAAIETGKRAARLERTGGPLPLGLKLKRGVFEKLVYAKIRQRIGLDQCELAVSGAAPISVDTLDFFAGIGLPIYEGFGMTESTAPATLNLVGRARVGTVGPPLPGVEVRLADDGEILIRGGNVTAGYYKQPAETAQALDEDGWLHTGDVGAIDPDGFVRIVDRKKELLITSGGKNISPANLENLVKQHPLIGQACAVGDRQPYVAALVVLDREVVPGWAAANGVGFDGDMASFAREPRVVAEIQHAVDQANQHVSKAEAIKRFAILPNEWTIEGEELTPTLKLKRRVVLRKYAQEIEDLYATPTSI
jgi:long-chain acyl-CoA synthetase